MHDALEGRVKILLSKLDVARRNKNRKYDISSSFKHLSHKFMGQVEKYSKDCLNVWNDVLFITMIYL